MSKISLIGLFIVFCGNFVFAQVLRPGEMIKERIPHEYIVIATAEQTQNFLGLSSMDIHPQSHVNLAKNKINVLRVKTSDKAKLNSLLSQKKIIFRGYNYRYYGDPREQSDPLIKDQEHHQIIGSPLVWKAGAKGDSRVIVAVTDDGVSLNHPDLKAAIWQNKKEILGNGIDDDGNGYIDDVVGWNFTDENNNPDGGSHGTHVAGIIGATIDNSEGVAGTAAGVTIMPLKWYGGKNPWTSALILETYAYAMNNGAKIINTSYNIDGFANDKAYREIVKILKDNGVLLFNSAGNSNKKNPPRQEVEEVTLVASTYGKLLPEKSKDQKSDFSNYGTGVDIAAPGGFILSTCLNNKYCVKSGTSMASPNAAGAAALIWSLYPQMNADQVLHKLFTSADNIDEKNGNYLGLLGAGRINVAKAMEKKIRPVVIKYLGINKEKGILTFHVKGILSKKAIFNNRNLVRVTSDSDIFTGELKYSKNLLQIKLDDENVKEGKYSIEFAHNFFIDPFGNKAIFKGMRSGKLEVTVL